MPKHLLIAAGLMLVSFVTLAYGLAAGSGGTDESNAAAGNAALGAHVIAADRALSPLQPAYAGTGAGSTTNPFTMGKSGELRTTRIPMPPPPSLQLPALPALPLSER